MRHVTPRQTSEDSGTVVSLYKFWPQMPDSPIRLIESYWASLREGNRLPARAQIDPRGLERILAHVFILERIGPGLARFRIAGSHLTRVAGVEVRGVPVSTLFRLPARPVLGAALDACFDMPAIVKAPLRADPIGRGAALPGDLILLPMTCHQGKTTRILGAIAMRGHLDALGYRLDLGQPEIRPVNGEQTATTSAPRPQPVALRPTRRRLELVPPVEDG